MLTYELKKSPGVPLYEALYRCLRQDILNGVIPPGSKLPSKRALSAHLEVSKITVETAYQELLAEGYIRAQEKIGYFVEDVGKPQPPLHCPPPPERPAEQVPPYLDFTANASAHFPFSVWNRLQRQVLLDLGEQLLQPMDNRGCAALRQAIAAHLAAFRGMRVDPDNIIIGAGTDFLSNLLVQLLGRDKVYAVEEPGYGKIQKIYAAAGAATSWASLDAFGVRPELLGDARVLHFSPSHHFPTGLVTSLKRRHELLAWAEQADGYLIEDDYDSEFRFHAHPLPALQSLDRQGRVIYMNTFSKSLTPAIRISYMVLPPQLMETFQKDLGFYSCTVASFQQYTLARFLTDGHFEKHINRMRKFYRSRRDQVISALEHCPWQEKLTVLEENAGLHFLLEVDTALPDDAIVALWARAGIRVLPLSRYYRDHPPASAARTLVINYSGLESSELFRLQTLEKLEG